MGYMAKIRFCGMVRFREELLKDKFEPLKGKGVAVSEELPVSFT